MVAPAAQREPVAHLQQVYEMSGNQQSEPKKDPLIGDNAFIESFNGKFRAECLNAHLFKSLDDAREKMEAWRKDYNEVRSHSAIGNKPPISLLFGSAALAAP